MILEVAMDQGMSLAVPYGTAVVTPILLIFAYILYRSPLNQKFYSAALGYTSPTFSCSLSNMVPAVLVIPFRRERVGSLGGKAILLGTIICVVGAIVGTLCKDLTINLWSLPLPLKEGNISTHHNESVSEILMKGSLLFVAILLGFILQRDCPPRNLALLGKMPVCFGLRRRDSRRGTALIMILLILLILMMNIAVASRAAVSAGTTSSAAGEDVDVGDKLPPDCVSVVNCGDCLPCSPRGQYFLCCD